MCRLYYVYLKIQGKVETKDEKMSTATTKQEEKTVCIKTYIKNITYNKQSKAKKIFLLLWHGRHNNFTSLSTALNFLPKFSTFRICGNMPEYLQQADFINLLSLLLYHLLDTCYQFARAYFWIHIMFGSFYHAELGHSFLCWRTPFAIIIKYLSWIYFFYLCERNSKGQIL